MASISSVSSSNSTNTSSLYNSANTITGLASGLDTESMIENLVSSYNTKIQNLQSKVTTYEWKQEAYRDIITDMVGFNTKYSSYTSSTNLASKSFFNNATIVESNGANASAVSASGRTSSTVEINAVKSLATAARYTVGNGNLNASNVASEAMNLNNSVAVGKLSGSMTLGYGGKSIYLNFTTDDVFESASDLAKNINEQLANQTISYDTGGSDKASTVIQAVVDGNSVKLQAVNSSDSNNVWVKSASSSLQTAFGVTPSSSSTSDAGAKTLNFDRSAAVEDKTALEYLSTKGIEVSIDGASKKITISQQEIDDAKTADPTLSDNDAFLSVLNSKLDSEFSGHVSAELDSSGKLKFSLASDYQNHSLSVTSDASKVLGFESLSNYVNTGKKLGDLIDFSALPADAKVGETDDGKALYSLTINGKQIGQFSEDTTLESVMSAINSNSDAGVTVSYSKTTNMFVFKANETGADGKIEFGNDLASTIFGGGTTNAGSDAVFQATVNGQTLELTRSSNSVDIDGLTVSLKNIFGTKEEVQSDGSTKTVYDSSAEAVSFTNKADTDTIVSAIKSFVEEYNSMVTKIKKAYSTMPLQKSDGSSYEPLTDDDMADMSDTAIANYEEKAKTGLLFGDYDLSAAYEGLRSAVDTLASGTNLLSEIGITTSYSDGLTTLSLNESTLKSVLETDPDKVRDVFTSNTENGDSYAGLMQGLSKQLNKYVATTGATKGILIEKAGSTLAPTSIYSNTWQSAIDSLEEQIEKWQDKLSDKVDYYTSKFSSLETLIYQLNSQSSMLSQMTGG
jgi:flagellar hook-associated protein 2